MASSNLDTKVEQPSERRLYRRFGLSLAAEIDVGGKNGRCVIADISLGGARISHDDIVGDANTLILKPDVENPALRIVGSVVQATAQHYNLRFDLDPDAEMDMTLFLVSLPETLTVD